MTITQNERGFLRELAKHQAEIAALPIIAEREMLWHDLNDGKTEHPLVTMEFHGLAEEIYPSLTCESQLARMLELQMTRLIYKHEHYKDDRVIPSAILLNVQNAITPFNYTPNSYRAKTEGMGYMYVHAVHDFLADSGIFKPSAYTVDAGLVKTMELKAEIEEILGDILPVQITFPAPMFCPGNTLIRMMSMETMFSALMDYPDLFHQTMRRLTDDYHAYIDAIEAGGAIVPNNNAAHVPMDTYGYTRDLPSLQDLNRPTKFSDVWAYSNSQETVGISPTMFDEFYFTYIKEIADRCGLFSYGCCEPVHTLWEPCLSRLKTLRKVSVSPWCDENAIAEMIRGKKIVYQRKPFPNFISVDSVFDDNAFLSHMEKTVKAAHGCPLEVTFRDITSANGDPSRLTRAVELTREAFARYWQG